MHIHDFQQREGVEKVSFDSCMARFDFCIRDKRSFWIVYWSSRAAENVRRMLRKAVLGKSFDFLMKNVTFALQFACMENSIQNNHFGFPSLFLHAFRLKSKTNTKRIPNVIDRSAFQDPCDGLILCQMGSNGLFLVVLQRKKPKLRRKTVAKAKEEEKSFHISKVGLLYIGVVLDVVCNLREHSSMSHKSWSLVTFLGGGPPTNSTLSPHPQSMWWLTDGNCQLFLLSKHFFSHYTSKSSWMTRMGFASTNFGSIHHHQPFVSHHFYFTRTLWWRPSTFP